MSYDSKELKRIDDETNYLGLIILFLFAFGLGYVVGLSL